MKARGFRETDVAALSDYCMTQIRLGSLFFLMKPGGLNVIEMMVGGGGQSSPDLGSDKTTL
jgi:hypothetical protein